MGVVLLTGASGFIALHVLNSLLERGHTVVGTVRSEEKASAIRALYPNVPSSQLSFAIVPDIAVPGAFDEAVQNPSLTAVIHTASPFHFNVTDVKRDLLDPAVLGTTGVLAAIKKYAPGVKQVAITSSFASIIDGNKPASWDHTYDENDWNPITEAEAENSPSHGYRASKTFAEKAAWKFVEEEKPNFTLATINPPLVFGPITPSLTSLSSLNTSNERVRNLITGKNKTAIPDTGAFLWVDVRDLALAHVLAIELPAAAKQRFFVTAGHFSNKQLVEILRKNFPEYKDQLPGEDVEGGDFPEGNVYGFDNSRSKKVLGLEYRSLEESIVDLVKTLKELE